MNPVQQKNGDRHRAAALHTASRARARALLAAARGPPTSDQDAATCSATKKKTEKSKLDRDPRQSIGDLLKTSRRNMGSVDLQ